jgi:hypothetical protein
MEPQQSDNESVCSTEQSFETSDSEVEVDDEEKCEVNEDFEARDDTELSIKTGSFIRALAGRPGTTGGWVIFIITQNVTQMKGEMDGKIGWFPSRVVTKVVRDKKTKRRQLESILNNFASVIEIIG